MPITEGVCTVLDGVPLGDLVATLMQRDPTSRVSRDAARIDYGF